MNDIGYWPLDGISSPEPDLSGNWHPGTLTGTTYADDPPFLRQPSQEWFDRAIAVVGGATVLTLAAAAWNWANQAIVATGGGIVSGAAFINNN